MGGLAPGKLKSRRGWPSSPRRLIHGCYFFDPGFKNSLREKLYQLCGNGDTLIAIDSRRPGLFWSAKVALSFAATGSRDANRYLTASATSVIDGWRNRHPHPEREHGRVCLVFAD